MVVKFDGNLVQKPIILSQVVLCFILWLAWCLLLVDVKVLLCKSSFVGSCSKPLLGLLLVVVDVEAYWFPIHKLLRSLLRLEAYWLMGFLFGRLCSCGGFCDCMFMMMLVSVSPSWF